MVDTARTVVRLCVLALAVLGSACRPTVPTTAAASAQPDATRETYHQELERLVFEQIARHGGAIRQYASAYGVDPAVVISIIYAEKIQYELDKLRKAKDVLIQNPGFARLFRKSAVSWAALSAGFTHIKPAFALETKELADRIPALRNELHPEEVAPNGYIDDPVVAIKIATVALAVLQEQWRSDPRGVDISSRPAILATLYNLGYERSRPHPDPVSGGSTMPVIVNGIYIEDLSFGDRVERLCAQSVYVRRLAPVRAR